MAEKEEKEKDLREEAREIFRKFYEKSKDIQKATTETVKEITEKTLKGAQPTAEKLKEITEGIAQGIQEATTKVGGRFEGVVKSLQDLTSKASSSLKEIITGVKEGFEEVTKEEKGRECVRFITERRSITYFDPKKELSEDLIREIINLATTAPSGWNLQPWEVIVVMSREKKKRLMEICYNQRKVLDAGANIVIIANTKAHEDNLDRVIDSWIELGYISQRQKKKVREDILAGWQSPEKRKRKAIRDSALFAMNIMILARMYGLETHPIEGFDEAKLKRFLGIGKEKLVPLIISIGYPDTSKKINPRAYRFSFDEIGRIV